MFLNGTLQYRQHILRLDRPIRMDAVAFPCVFINRLNVRSFPPRSV